MIICRTPYRISFFGGGSDYPAWYLKHGGVVLATTIDKYCYITCRELPPFFEHRYRVVCWNTDVCETLEEVSNPAVRAVVEYLDIRHGLEIHYDGDLPSRSGMGSSSSFVVCLLHAMHSLKGYMPSRKQLADESIHIEQEILRENVGSQDQVSAAYGGFNKIGFHQDGQITVEPIVVKRERLADLSSHLMLFYSGITRNASDIASQYSNSLDTRRASVDNIIEMVYKGIDILNSDRDIGEFGALLHEGWMEKRGIHSQVSNDAIDQIYEKARAGGALGGKLLGAGGGGFLLLFVPPERQERIRAMFENLVNVPFNLDNQGSQVVLYNPEPSYDYSLAAARQLAGRATAEE